MAIDEHFSPAGLDLDEYIARGDRNAAGHLIRYLWAVECLRDDARGRVLDLGCGAGYGTYLLARACPRLTFAGVDYDPEAIAEARGRYSLPNLSFAVGDAVRWDETIGAEAYDVVVSFDTIEHVAHREIFMRNVVAHLEDGGRFFLSTPCAHAEPVLAPEWEHHEIEYSLATLYDMLARFFATIRRPENGTLPHLELFERLHGTGMEYLLLLNPVICEEPIRVASPFEADLRRGVGSFRAVAGDWGGWGVDMPGLVDSRTGLAYLFTPPAGAGALMALDLGVRGPEWHPVAGDWSGRGVDTLGAVDVRSGEVILLDRNAWPVTRSSSYIPRVPHGALPVAGDWTGGGRDSVGLFVPSTREWQLPGCNTIVFGPESEPVVPLTGRWAEVDSIGLYASDSGTFFLRSTPAAGPADVAMRFGLPGLLPFAGDWDGDGIATAGVCSFGDRKIYLRNRHEPGDADVEIKLPSAIR